MTYRPTTHAWYAVPHATITIRRTLLELVVRHPEALEYERPMADAVADGLGDGVGLLEDLLEHEGLVAALLRAFVVPVELDRLVHDALPVSALEDGALGPDGDDLPVARELDGAGLAQECRRVRGEEHLIRAESDDERDLVSRADEKAGVVVVDDDEREVALELAECEPHGLDQIALVVALDQVSHGLGVRLGCEDVTIRREARLQLTVVLDDPVQDDGELRGVAAGERMRVRLRDPAVCRPARVRHAGRRR